jgi:hypothetical protein
MAGFLPLASSETRIAGGGKIEPGHFLEIATAGIANSSIPDRLILWGWLEPVALSIRLLKPVEQ